MALADARARLPMLEAAELDEAADRAWIERLADGCIRYTPMAALDPPNRSFGQLGLLRLLEREACQHAADVDQQRDQCCGVGELSCRRTRHG